MKAKLHLTILLSLFVLFVSAQIPQGFNYQAIARDGTGNILPNMPLQAMIYIQSSTGTIFWKELHNSITTNSFGLFTIVVGTGTRQSESTVATFNLIDWTVTPKYLRTEIYYSSSWKDLGTSQILTVPYAMVAENLAGSVKKLAVEGETSGQEEALFEVKNKDGQTVFAVYNEGVRVYVSNGAKALKGGFAVGGFGTDKAESTKYLFVGKDSVRIYLDTNPLTKAVKSGFAVGGYDLTKGTIQNYLNVSPDSVRIYIDGDPETKKLKGGFAVGGYDMTKGIIQDYLDISPDSVRIYIDDTDGAGKGKKGGFAVGGFDLTKNGNASFLNVEIDTIGIINPSKNRIQWYPLKNSFLTGRVLVESKDSVGINSFASGYESKAVGDWSQALGYKAISRGYYSTAIGKNALARKRNSFAFGDSARATSIESYAIGRKALASGYRSFALGSAGVDSLGGPTEAAHATGNYSFAIGQGSEAIGEGAFAFGIFSRSLGSFSTAMGYGTTACSAKEMALGTFNTIYTPFSTSDWHSNDRLFVIGNGNLIDSKSDAFVILKNGNIAIGHALPTQKLDVMGNARFRFIGSGAYVGAVNRTSDGTLTTSTSDISQKENISTLANCLADVLKLRGISFTWKNEPEMGYRIGFIAQEVEQVIPELVFTNPADGLKGVNYPEITAVLVEAMKEQQQQIELTKQENLQLKSQLQSLLEEVDQIKGLLVNASGE